MTVVACTLAGKEGMALAGELLTLARRFADAQNTDLRWLVAGPAQGVGQELAHAVVVFSEQNMCHGAVVVPAFSAPELSAPELSPRASRQAGWRAKGLYPKKLFLK